MLSDAMVLRLDQICDFAQPLERILRIPIIIIISSSSSSSGSSSSSSIIIIVIIMIS